MIELKDDLKIVRKESDARVLNLVKLLLKSTLNTEVKVEEKAKKIIVKVNVPNVDLLEIETNYITFDRIHLQIKDKYYSTGFSFGKEDSSSIESYYILKEFINRFVPIDVIKEVVILKSDPLQEGKNNSFKLLDRVLEAIKL